MYALIWLAFFEILLGVFSHLASLFILPVHAVLGAAILGLAFQVRRLVRSTQCPDRIKRITRITLYLAVFQVALGVVLAAAVVLSLAGLLVTFIAFVHVVNALAIITQASSSATAFDMWEEKEFVLPQPATPS